MTEQQDRLNIALPCTEEPLDMLGIKVLYCLAPMKARAHVIGDGRISSIRHSRYCHRYAKAPFPKTADGTAEFTDWLNDYIARHHIDIVLASNIETVYLLSRIRSDITGCAIYPMSDIATIDLVNDKWAFAERLGTHGIATPPAVLITKQWQDHPDQLGALDYPVMAKPLRLHGGRGIVKLNDQTAAADHLAKLNADRDLPLIVQNFVDGEDAGVSFLSIGGGMKAASVQLRRPDHVTFIDREDMLDIARRIIAATGYEGIAHIDIRLDKDGQNPLVLECNPRFWFTLPESMWHGINFVQLGIDTALNRPLANETARYLGTLYTYQHLLTKTLPVPGKWKTFNANNRRASWEVLSDPLPLAINTGSRIGRRLFKN